MKTQTKLTRLWRNLKSPRGLVALPNALGLMFKDGKESLLVDSSVTTPVTSPGNGKYALWVRGAAYNTAKLCTGASGAGNAPLGISPDAPYQAGDVLTVFRLGAMPFIMLGWSDGAITIDHLVIASAATAGAIGDLTTQGNGTYWVIGRAAATVSAAGNEISFVPCMPYEITVSGGGGTYALAGPGV